MADNSSDINDDNMTSGWLASGCSAIGPLMVVVQAGFQVQFITPGPLNIHMPPASYLSSRSRRCEVIIMTVTSVTTLMALMMMAMTLTTTVNLRWWCTPKRWTSQQPTGNPVITSDVNIYIYAAALQRTMLSVTGCHFPSSLLASSLILLHENI